MVNFIPLVTVAGTPLPEPATYDANTATIVDSARNASGVMIGAVIRDDVAKVSLTWRFLTVAEWAAVNKLFSERDGGAFINSVTFLDQTAGTYKTRQMYISDRKAGAFVRSQVTGEIKGWKDCSLSLIEV